MTIAVEAANTGAYIGDVNLSSVTESQVEVLRAALGEHGVLYFRNQSLSPDEHIAFAEKFASININRFFNPVQNYPQIAEVKKEPEQSSNIGENWHTDHSYDQIPALGSVLVARALPDRGGDTLFSSMFKAYDALSIEMQKQLCGLTAAHSSRHAFGAQAYDKDEKQDFNGRLGNAAAAVQDAVHPVVVKHPISGRSAIYVNPDFTLRINELPEKESEELLAYLYGHCQSETFIHRFQWQEGSVAFWDNRATWHKALNDYAGQYRLMHRITVEGVALLAA